MLSYFSFELCYLFLQAIDKHVFLPQNALQLCLFVEHSVDLALALFYLQ